MRGLLLLMVLSLASIARAEGGCSIAGPEASPGVVTIEEFADFQCPFCVRGANTMKLALKEFKGRVRLVYRHLPIPAHAHALEAAKAFSAVCLQNPRLARGFYDELFAHQDLLAAGGETYLEQVAQNLGVNVETMKTDMASAAVASMLDEDRKAAEAHGFNGTPSFLIGHEPVVGALPYPEIKKVIEKELAGSH